MTTKLSVQNSDLTFVGSGISSSFTLLNFLKELKENPLSDKVQITLIDRYTEFFTGVPYGSRSGYSVLLITSLQNFLPEPELSRFLEWLQVNKVSLLATFEKEGGQLSKEWLVKHKENIKSNDWKDIFIPRRFFGLYVEEIVKTHIADALQNGQIAIQYLQKEVAEVEKTGDTFELKFTDGTTIPSKKVVLSVGSLPVRQLWQDQDLIQKDNLLVINDAYKPSLKEVLQTIENFVLSRKGKDTRVLIVGANASGLEMLYKLNDVDTIKNHIHYITMLSTLGLSPDSIVDEEKLKQYTPNHLHGLKAHEVLTAKEIAEATYKDLEVAEGIKLGAASTVNVISQAFGSLLGKLNNEELKNFACLYGNEIGRRQRCAGHHYSENIDKLKAQDKFEHIAGKFSTLQEIEGNEYAVVYKDTSTGMSKTKEQPVHVVINCVGSTNLSEEKIPALIKSLVAKKYVRPNASRIGFEVNESLESLPNLHIMGPLLAGNVLDQKAVWHVEHCGRIVWLSGVLSKSLHSYFSKSNELIK